MRPQAHGLPSRLPPFKRVRNLFIEIYGHRPAYRPMLGPHPQTVWSKAVVTNARAADVPSAMPGADAGILKACLRVPNPSSGHAARV